MPAHLIDTGRQFPFEIGARLDALICYPSWSDDRRENIAKAICAWMVSEWMRYDPDRRAELRAAFPQYAPALNRVSLAKLHDRREKALVAGQSFLPFMKEPAIGELPLLKGESRVLSQDTIATFLWPAREDGAEVGYSDRLGDLKKHRIRAFYSVAHLVAAYQYVARERAGPAEAVLFDYQDLEFHRTIVAKAREFAGYFRAAPDLKNIAAKLIDIDWRE